MRHLLLAVLLLGGAEGVPVTEPLPARVVNWPAGQSGELKLTSQAIALSIPFASNGSFTLIPPIGDEIEPALGRILDFFKTPTLGESCTGKGAAVPTNTRYALLKLQSVNGGEVRLESPDGQSRALLLYLTRPTTLRGTVTCPDAVYHVSGTYHAGLVLVPMRQDRADAQNRPQWHWDDRQSIRSMQWTITEK